MAVECAVIVEGQETGEPKRYKFVAVPQVGDIVSLTGRPYVTYKTVKIKHTALPIDDDHQPSIQVTLRTHLRESA
jgi:hypothetical protein